MESQNDLTPETLAEEVDVASTDGTTEAASDVAPKAVEDASKAPQPKNPDGMTLEELNASLGKQFKSKDAAIKAIKDTFSYVGKKNPGVSPNEITELKNELFFTKNPALEQHRDLLEAVALKNNVPLHEAAALDSFKSYVEKAEGYEKTQAAKSVLHSNPKLGAVRDSMQSARELAKSAAQTSDPFEASRIQSEAATQAVAGVLDAYDLK